MNVDKIKRIRVILGTISFYIFLAGFVAISIIASVYKNQGNSFYFFNNRFDVVLSGSMSIKNAKHLDFLEGHDDQIQINDLVISSKIDNETKLEVYDIVIFHSKDFGNNMHRIVEKAYDGQMCHINKFSKTQYHGIDVFEPTALSSSVIFDTRFLFSDITVVTYSDEPYDRDEYYLNIESAETFFNVSSVQSDEGYYINTLRYHNESEKYRRFSLTKHSYTFSSKFAYIKVYGKGITCEINPELLDGSTEQTHLFNAKEKYKIRGDAIENDDGWFYKEQIYSKVHTVIPKVGYIIRFTYSKYGIIILLILSVLPVLITLLVNYRKKNVEE